MIRSCETKLAIIGQGFIELRGEHGEVFSFPPNKVLAESDLPEGACPGFRGAVLAAYGPGGPRRLGPDPWVIVDGKRVLREAPFFPHAGLGHHPEAQADEADRDFIETITLK